MWSNSCSAFEKDHNKTWNCNQIYHHNVLLCFSSYSTIIFNPLVALLIWIFLKCVAKINFQADNNYASHHVCQFGSMFNSNFSLIISFLRVVENEKKKWSYYISKRLDDQQIPKTTFIFIHRVFHLKRRRKKNNRKEKWRRIVNEITLYKHVCVCAHGEMRYDDVLLLSFARTLCLHVAVAVAVVFI